MTDRPSRDDAHGVPPVSRRLFLSGSLAAAVAASSLAAGATAAKASTLASASAASAGSAEALRAGAGRAAISIPDSLLPLDNFTTVHDDLYARVLLLESGTEKVAIVTLDMTSVNSSAVLEEMTQAVTSAAGVPAGNVLISVTHAFSSPHVPVNGASTAQEDAWEALLVGAVKTAVTNAAGSLTDARIGYGAGNSDVNVNRNVDTIDGWWLGTGEQGPSDKSVRVTRIDNLDGVPIAILANFNVQSSVMMDSVMNDGALPITADLAGATVDHVEGQYGGSTIGFFLCGATGDQAPQFVSNRYVIDKDLNWSQVDAHDAGWILLTVQGERLGTEVVRVAQTIDTSRGRTPVVRLVTGSVTATEVTQTPGQNAGPTKTHAFTPDGTTTLPVWALQVGEAVFVMVKEELSTPTTMDITQHSPFRYTNVISNLQGGDKNMPDAWNYDHITYEALDSFYAKGTAEAVAATAIKTLSLLRP